MGAFVPSVVTFLLPSLLALFPLQCKRLSASVL